MANYEPIPFVKEAVKLEAEDTGIASTVDGEVEIGGVIYVLYRDTQGHYTLVNTKFGQQRANENDWVMIESAIVPEVPAVPAVPGTQATGSFLVASAAAGDGVVGFDYNGIVYAVSPAASATPAVTAQALVDLVNLGGQAQATLNVETVDIIANFTGVAENITLIDVTTDSVQTGTPSGMAGGVDDIPGTPLIPEQPAIFSVWTDANFTATFQLVP